jgi:single-strand DNA-binding protein
VYIEGQLSTRKWKDEKSGQDKYSTEVIIQGYNSSLTMLGSGVKNDNSSQAISNNSDEASQTQKNDLDDEIPF